MKRGFLTFCMTVLVVNALAQTYQGAMSEFYFGRCPSIHSEAMGKCGAAVQQGMFSAFLNPALLSFEPAAGMGLSVNGPLYDRNRARYTAGSMISKKAGAGSFGLSANLFRSRWPGSDLVDDMSQYTVSYAFRLFSDVSIGVNLNWMRYRFDNQELDWDIHAFPVDVGIVKKMDSHPGPQWLTHVQAGAVIMNAAFSSTGEQEPKDPLPVVAKGELSGDLALKPSWHWLNVHAAAGYQHVLNGQYRRGFRGGLNFGFYDMVFVRTGFYKETIDRRDNTLNRKSIEDFTWGLGLHLPLNQWTGNRIPAVLILDGVHLKQPPYNRIETDWEAFTGVSVSLMLVK